MLNYKYLIHNYNYITDAIIVIDASIKSYLYLKISDTKLIICNGIIRSILVDVKELYTSNPRCFSTFFIFLKKLYKVLMLSILLENTSREVSLAHLLFLYNSVLAYSSVEIRI